MTRRAPTSLRQPGDGEGLMLRILRASQVSLFSWYARSRLRASPQ